MTQRPGRRQFVQAAAAAIATSQFPILGANERINVGIVGLGGRGNDHINSYNKLNTEVRIAGLCDVNQAARERAIATVKRTAGYTSPEFSDMRKMFESKDIDAVAITTPNHWHALATIWACQAGKDVYVEKPASHNIYEGRQMVKAARKYNRMVQVGSQSRSLPFKQRAVQLLREGVIGKVYHARGECYRRRFSIGKTPDSPVPAGVDWSLFLGPAQMRPFNANRFIYNWHWFWDTGNGDIGNQGVHEMDIALWGLGVDGYPTSVSSTGGKFAWDDDQETPNTLQTTFSFPNAQLTFDTRNLPTPPEGVKGEFRPNYVGNIFFGDLGFMILDHSGFEVYKSAAGNISGEAARGAGAGGREKYELAMKEKSEPNDTEPHMLNFFKGVRARDHKLLNAEIEIGARSAAYCHLGNNAYRAGRMLKTDPKTGRVLGDAAAEAFGTRKYRAPYLVPENV
ncbi:MAG TPA: Gfo/Idh/MocA family oxidoreductase [Bryobacteraceae bacterium]|nr:Gfo/Idh/MocA family oxidoreductase [Bryobacteraceae bacterium]